MKITCGSCAAKYTVSDDKVHGKTVKVKCRKCGAVIVVSATGDVQTTGGSAPGATPPGAEVTYTVSVSDTDQRNLTLAQIISAYNEGAIDAETYVWAEGMDDWQPLKDIDSIVDALHVAASGEAAEDDEEDLNRTVAMADPSGLSGYGGMMQPAAAAAPFGASTVAIPSPGASAPRAAAAQASAGTTGGFFGAASSGGNAGAATAAASSTSAENSAIFSLNMLTAKVGAGDAAPAKASTGGSEDSGLIDLKALAAGMGGSDGGAGVAAAAPAGGLFPLGAPPPVAASAPMTSIPAPAQSGPNRGMVIGLAAAVVVLGAALVFILVRDSGPPPTTASTTTAAATTPTTEPTPTETAPTAEPSAVASAAPSASASTKVAAKGTAGPRPTGAAKTTAGAPTTTAAKTAPKPPSGGGGCGCASDDLMCHMRCSQKK